jgi:hypothetical protein
MVGASTRAALLRSAHARAASSTKKPSKSQCDVEENDGSVSSKTLPAQEK